MSAVRRFEASERGRKLVAEHEDQTTDGVAALIRRRGSLVVVEAEAPACRTARATGNGRRERDAGRAVSSALIDSNGGPGVPVSVIGSTVTSC